MPTPERGDASLHFEAVGSGEPLGFIHGRGGNSLPWWQQVDCFAAHHRCILIDLQGHSMSRGDSTATAADESDVLAVLVRSESARSRLSVIPLGESCWAAFVVAHANTPIASNLLIVRTIPISLENQARRGNDRPA